MYCKSVLPDRLSNDIDSWICNLSQNKPSSRSPKTMCFNGPTFNP